MHDAIVVTLAVGRRYADMAAAFMGYLSHVGNAVLAVTDTPGAFSGTGVELLPYVPETAHVWHGKRHAVRAGLERARTVYFMDADHVLAPGAEAPRLAALPPGPHSRIWRLPLAHIDFHKLGMADASIWIGFAAEVLGIENWRQKLWWWGDSMWALAGGELDRCTRFCAAWDAFAAFVGETPPPHPFMLGDGVALSFAAHLGGWGSDIHRTNFDALEGAFEHAEIGGWRMMP